MAITVVPCCVLCVRDLVRKSREIDKQVDYSRIRPWKGDES